MAAFPTFTPTILLLNLPPTSLCGIDLLSFTTTPRFQGIKDLPPGWHFLFTSETPSLSLRSGFWFYIPAASSPSPLLVRTWDPATSSLVPCTEADYPLHRASLSDLWKERLTPYRQSSSEGVERGDWVELSRHVNARLLTRFTGRKEEWRITTASCARQDRDEIPGLNDEEVGEESELWVLGIDLKRTWREGAVGRERTEAAVDRSWALEEVVRRWSEDGEQWGDVVLGEMEVCLLMVLTVANYSCLEEWKRVIGLVLTCKRALRKRETWFVAVVGLLKRQMERVEDVEGGLFDMSDEGGAYLKGLLKGFKRTLEQVFNDDEGSEVKEELEELEAFLKAEYGWELSDSFVRRGILELEDGEQVEMEMNELEGEDERGEYAPVVVALE